ncbi:hypothetical protein HYC85_014743 [Camellia sinensis]|uniref:Epsilon-coat protein n=1 Tax=Camellia sinensis TaxID=4442 RepID=A0A7J7HAI5_CAMSI|nr:hypothetical protein HYC85_014743 [Camellia sinensis]
MENADVKTDSQTFSYLIGNCDREEDIVKYYEELKHSGVQITKYIFMALTNAYVACGQFEKAKQFPVYSTVDLLKQLKDKFYANEVATDVLFDEVSVMMYQALLASGDHKSATNMLNKIPKDDPHVRCVIKASQATYIKPTSSKEKKAMEMVRK